MKHITKLFIGAIIAFISAIIIKLNKQKKEIKMSEKEKNDEENTIDIPCQEVSVEKSGSKKDKFSEEEISQNKNSSVEEKFNQAERQVPIQNKEKSLEIEELKNLIIKQDKNILILNKKIESSNSNTSEIKAQMQAVQELAEEKGAKLRRYEDGYDLKILSTFLKDIFNIREELNEKNEKVSTEIDEFLTINKDENIEEVEKEKQTKRFKNNMNDLVQESLDDLSNMLGNNNVLKYEIKKGDVYAGKELEAKIIETIPTDDENLDGTIAEIKSDGFYIETSENTKKQIITTKVKTYKLTK